MMSPGDMVDSLLIVPHRQGGGSLHGADCWGIVELWYKHVLGIDLDDRAAHPSGCGGMQDGFDAARYWGRLSVPRDHCLVVMRAHGLEAGHVGVFYSGSVLHSLLHVGARYQRIDDKRLSGRVTSLLEYTG